MSWGRNGTGNNLANIPSPLPLPPKLRQRSPVTYRYYMNACTYGYSFAWWNWEQWEEELDRMALWGVNLPLAFIGQEYVVHKWLAGLGLNDSDILSWMSGPAFLPWYRMNNIYHWGGPLTMSWILQQRDLQLRVLARMREFGMQPVLPGYAGHFPQSILNVYPGLNLIQNADWASFNSSYSQSYLLDPLDPMYVPLGVNYTKLLLAVCVVDPSYVLCMLWEYMFIG